MTAPCPCVSKKEGVDNLPLDQNSGNCGVEASDVSPANTDYVCALQLLLVLVEQYFNTQSSAGHCSSLWIFPRVCSQRCTVLPKNVGSICS